MPHNYRKTTALISVCFQVNKNTFVYSELSGMFGNQNDDTRMLTIHGQTWRW